MNDATQYCFEFIGTQDPAPAHALLSASGSHRWMNCPGSVKAEDPYRHIQKSSPFAEEGTEAHNLAEASLRVGQSCLDEYENREMAEYVQVYTDYVNNLAHGADFSAVETRVDFSEWVPDGFGTADSIAIKDGTLYVTDLKYGKGVFVSAVQNPQGMLYALGAYSMFRDRYDIKSVVITILQPRLDNISVWELNIIELLAFGEYASERANLTQQKNAPRKPSDNACKFCLAKHECPALLKLTHDTLIGEFDDLIPASKLTHEQMQEVLDNKKLIESWLSAVQDYAKEQLLEGNEFPGYKLVDGRSTRAWVDDKAAEATLVDHLGDEAYTPRKLLTPPQAEKVIGKKGFAEYQDLVCSTKSGPTLAKEDDARSAINVSVNDF